jgi:hypothetical protein
MAGLLDEAERALDDGDYAGCVRNAVAAYQELIGARPELVIKPPPRPAEGAPLTADRPRTMPRGPWPGTMGVRQTFDADGKPALVFDKDRFTMSEAIAYFEYVRDLVEFGRTIDAQRSL